MKFLLAFAAAAALATAPAAAQPAPPTHDHAGKSQAEMHEHCKAVMGKKMDPKARHDHSSEKSGAAIRPKKPLSQAEMKKMHEKCAAMMEAK